MTACGGVWGRVQGTSNQDFVIKVDELCAGLRDNKQPALPYAEGHSSSYGSLQNISKDL